MAKPPETRRLVFYFDYISSNAFLAWLELPRIAARHAVEIEARPVLFAGLLEAHGQLGPAEIPAKVSWMWRNNLRKAALLGVRLEPPAFHPFNPLWALRLSSLPMQETARRDLIDALFRAVWSERRHLEDEAVLARALADANLDGPALLAAAREPSAKQRLREQTDAAIAAGVFGVPSMQVGSELFWGYDDLPYLERHLAGEDPLDPKQLEAWLRPPRPSAMRRRFRETTRSEEGTET